VTYVGRLNRDLTTSAMERKNMPKKDKVTLNLDPDIWKRFCLYVVGKYGRGKKFNIEVEQALKEYLDKHEKEQA